MCNRSVSLHLIMERAYQLFPRLQPEPKVIKCTGEYKKFTVFNPSSLETSIPMHPVEFIKGEWIRLGYWEDENTLIVGTDSPIDST